MSIRLHFFIGILSVVMVTSVLVGAPIPQANAKSKSKDKDKIAVMGKYHGQTGKASWYGKQFHGRRTASGETYNMYDLTAAHLSLPFGTMVRVTNLKNHQSVIVKINDRGPHVAGRIIDLSFGAAREIGLDRSGVASVRLEVLDSVYLAELAREEQLRSEYNTYDRNSMTKVIKDSEKPDFVEEGYVSFNFFRNLRKHAVVPAPDELTAAHYSLPIGTRVRVTNLTNGRQVIVLISEHCSKFSRRIMEISRPAAEKIEMLPQLMAKVKIETVD